MIDYISYLGKIITEDPDVICEDISKTDFFDFYALLYVYQDRNHPEHEQVTRELKFLTDLIFKDHINQLFAIVISRITDYEHTDMINIMSDYGIRFNEDVRTAIEQGTKIPSSDNWWHGLERLSLDDKVSLLSELSSLRHNYGTTDETWNVELSNSLIDIANYGSSLNSQIAAIDKMYNLLHHGGFIIDYMDEVKWLEDALHYRDNANPAQILSQASSRIRALIGRSSYYDMDRSQVDDLKILSTAVRRYCQQSYFGVDIRYHDDDMYISTDRVNQSVKRRRITIKIAKKNLGGQEFLTVTDVSSEEPTESILAKLPLKNSGIDSPYRTLAKSLIEFSERIDYGKSAQLAYMEKIAFAYHKSGVPFSIWPKGSKPYKKLIKDPKAAYVYAKDIIKGRFEEAEPYIAKDAESAFYYTRLVLNPLGIERWPEAEKYIIKEPAWATSYAACVLGRRWLEAEPRIMKDASIIPRYVEDVIGGRWPEAEPKVVKNAETAYWYAKAIKERIPEAEKVLARGETHDGYTTFWWPIYYAIEILKPIGINRWPELERSMLKLKVDKYRAQEFFSYAVKFMGDRWPDGEKYIVSDRYYKMKYAKFLKELAKSKAVKPKRAKPSRQPKIDKTDEDDLMDLLG